MTAITPTDRRAPAPPAPRPPTLGNYDQVMAAFRASVKAPPPIMPADPELACIEEDVAATYQGEGRDDRVMEALGLAVEIADEAARTAIESCCARVSSGGEEWYEMESADAVQVDMVAEAFRYLQLRGPDAHGYRIIHNPAFPSLIRFEDVALACRVCGCTDTNACQGGCAWAEADLCTACEEKSA